MTGTAKNTAHLSINGENILLSPEGYFSTTLILPEGYSTISLQAEDKFKNIDRELLHIYLPSHDLMKPPDISEIPETPPLTEQEELISTNI